MAITTYSELKTAISEWMDRTDLTDEKLADIISLGEAGLNRELELLETDATITGTASSREIDVTSLSVREPISLFINYQAQEYELLKKPEGSFPYTNNVQEPRIWTMDGETIKFDCLLDAAYSFRFRYTSWFSLSDATPTNWLLNKYPDLYLSASIAWGAKFVADDGTRARYAIDAAAMIQSINWLESKKNKGSLNVDPALSIIKRRYGFYRW